MNTNSQHPVSVPVGGSKMIEPGQQGQHPPRRRERKTPPQGEARRSPGDQSRTAQQRLQRKLGQLVKLAQDYRGWSRNQLAKALGRDATKIIPQSGNPKLDLVTALADVLEWPVGEVAEMLTPPLATTRAPEGCEDLDARAMIHAGQAANLVQDCERAFQYGAWAEQIATENESRARAVNIQAVACDGLGRYDIGITSLRRGLDYSGVSETRRRLLLSNLAQAHMVYGNLDEAIAVATMLVGELEYGPHSLRDHCTLAFAYYVLGGTTRRLAPRLQTKDCWRKARDYLVLSMSFYRRIRELGIASSIDTIMHVSEGAIVECDAAMNPHRAEEALCRIELELDRFNELKDSAMGLNSLGWWCVFGSNIAFRWGGSRAARSLAILTNKAHEIADICQEWALWERVFSLEYHCRPEHDAGLSAVERILDSEDVRIIVGTMGRFPKFRQIGWRLLETSQILEQSKTP